MRSAIWVRHITAHHSAAWQEDSSHPAELARRVSAGLPPEACIRILLTSSHRAPTSPHRTPAEAQMQNMQHMVRQGQETRAMWQQPVALPSCPPQQPATTAGMPTNHAHAMHMLQL